MSRILALLHPWRLLLVLLWVPLLATAAPADPSGRVGRIAWINGAVHIHRSDSGESNNALLNWPLTSGDILSTASGARAVVHIGATALELDSGSVLEFVTIDDQRVQMRLLDGSLIARVRSRESAAEFFLDTRDGRFTLNEPGRYRFDVDRSTSSASVFSGGLHFEASDSALDISPGQRARLWYNGRTQYQSLAVENDDFARWSSRREREESGRYARYVSPEMTGAVDLDAYGTWSESAEYGAIWYPRAVPAGWAPYRSGRWVWVAPWGWTWIGDEPWGFAPFHYGRWVLYGGTWGWIPGRRIARPVYAPALVGWVGTPAAGVSVTVTTRPTVGWFPLAPREVYVPPYRCSPQHLRQVNATQVVNIHNLTAIVENPQAAVERAHYAHAKLPQALTVVASDALTHRRPVSEAMIPHRHAELPANPSLRLAPPVPAPRHATLERRNDDAPPFQGRAGRESGAPSADADSRRRSERPPIAAPTPPAVTSTAPPTAASPAAVRPESAVQAAPVNPRTERGHVETGRPLPSPGAPLKPTRPEARPELAAPPATQPAPTRAREPTPAVTVAPPAATLPPPPPAYRFERPPIEAARPAASPRPEAIDRRQPPPANALTAPAPPRSAERPASEQALRPAPMPAPALPPQRPEARVESRAPSMSTPPAAARVDPRPPSEPRSRPTVALPPAPGPATPPPRRAETPAQSERPARLETGSEAGRPARAHGGGREDRQQQGSPTAGKP